MNVPIKKEVLTTGEVARICHVAPRTVTKWFDTGELRGYRIPGSRDRRIPIQQLLAFMRAHSIPLEGLDGGICRVMIFDASVPDELIDSLNRSQRYEIRTAANGFEAGVLAQEFHPHVIVLGTVQDPDDLVAMCENIRSSSALEATKLVAAIPKLTEHHSNWLLQRGFDGCLPSPYTPEQLMAVVEDVTNLVG